MGGALTSTLASPTVEALAGVLGGTSADDLT